jgi:hypothetical protein
MGGMKRKKQAQGYSKIRVDQTFIHVFTAPAFVHRTGFNRIVLAPNYLHANVNFTTNADREGL